MAAHVTSTDSCEFQPSFVGGTATVVAARQEAEEFVAFVTRQLGRAMVAYLHAWRRHAQSCATSRTQLRFASAVGVERRCAAAIQGLRSTSMARHRARRLLRCGQTAAVRDCLAALRGAAARGALAMQQAASAASHLRKRRLFRAMAQLHRLPAAVSLDRCAAAWWAHRAAGAALRSWATARAATVMLERVRQVRLALSWARVRGRLTLASRANLHKKRFSLPPPKPAAAAPLLQRLTTTDAAGFRAFADRAAARRVELYALRARHNIGRRGHDMPVLSRGHVSRWGWRLRRLRGKQCIQRKQGG